MLSQIQSLRVAAVVEDCTHKLDILGYTLQVQKSRVRGPGAKQEVARLDKLKSDCESISQQMSTLHSELEEKQSFSSLLKTVEEKKQQERNEEAKRNLLIVLHERKQSLLQKQEEVRAAEEKKMKELTSPSTAQKRQLSSDMEILQKDGELRIQMKEKEILKAEKQMEDQLNMMKEKLNEEERIHEEALKVLHVLHEELQQQLEKWQHVTKHLQQEKREQLNSVCCKKTLNYDRLMEMKRRMKAMKQVVIEDREEQEEQRQLQVQIRFAIKLQAWWRGCMVRKGLGRFKKPVEKKKSKKKGKKGKKGKK